MEGYLMVKPKGMADQASAKVTDATAYTKADFDKQYKTNNDTQAILDSVVKYILSTNYKDFPTVVALVEDAVDQLNFAKDAKDKTDAAAKKEDWQQGTLWANQWWQYQVKAADTGLRVKTYLEEHGAKVVTK
jgi:nitrous-oxide reductase